MGGGCEICPVPQPHEIGKIPKEEEEAETGFQTWAKKALLDGTAGELYKKYFNKCVKLLKRMKTICERTDSCLPAELHHSNAVHQYERESLLLALESFTEDLEDAVTAGCHLLEWFDIDLWEK